MRATFVVTLLSFGCSSVGSQSGAVKDPPSTSGPANEACMGDTPPGSGCTLTQGYWKNHPKAWPVLTLTLGTVKYSQDQLLSIFQASVGGNGLIALAHQLIAAKLNLAAGASSAALGSAIADADALIGGLVVPPVGGGSLPTSQTSTLTDKLDSFNSGQIGPGHCGDGKGGSSASSCGDGGSGSGPPSAGDGGNNSGGDGGSPPGPFGPPTFPPDGGSFPGDDAGTIF
jgi:hypothetical protein